MKRRKTLIFQVKTAFRVPARNQYAGLKNLYKEVGLLGNQGNVTEEGKKALSACFAPAKR